MTRICPARGCADPLDAEWKVMCGPHWHLVPRELQRMINRQGLSQQARKLVVDKAVQTLERIEFGGRLL